MRSLYASSGQKAEGDPTNNQTGQVSDPVASTYSFEQSFIF